MWLKAIGEGETVEKITPVGSARKGVPRRWYSSDLLLRERERERLAFGDLSPYA